MLFFLTALNYILIITYLGDKSQYGCKTIISKIIIYNGNSKLLFSWIILNFVDIYKSE